MPVPVQTGAEARKWSRQRAKGLAKQRRAKPKAKPVYGPPTPKKKVYGPPTPKPKAKKVYGPPTPKKKKKKSTLPSTFRSDAAQGGPTKAQKRAIDKNIARVEKRVRRRGRRALGGDNPIKALERSGRESMEALSALRSSDPEKYARKTKRASRSGADNFVRDVANEAQEQLTIGAEKTKRAMEARSRREDPVGRKLAVNAGLSTDAGAKELIDMAANMPSSLYITAAAAKEASEGNLDRAKKLAKDFDETSALSAAVLHGDLKEAKKRAAHHPIGTSLEFSGIKAVLGRGAAAAARHPVGPKGFRDKAKNYASTDRPNLHLYPDKDGPQVRRAYSKDLINNRAQKAAERRARRKGRDPDVDHGTYLVPTIPGRGRNATLGKRSRKGRPAEPATPVRARLRRTVDTRQQQHDRTLAARTQTAEKRARLAFRKNKVKEKQGAGVQLVVEGVVRRGTERADLKARLRTLEENRRGLQGESLKRNREEAREVRQLFHLPKKQLDRILDAAKDYSKAQEGVQTRGRAAGIWDEESQSKRYMPAVQTHGLAGTKLDTADARDAVAKIIERRARRGKTLPAGARAALDDALDARRADEHGGRKIEYPGVAAAKAAIAGGTRAASRVEKRKRPREAGLHRDEIKGYLDRQAATKRPEGEELAAAVLRLERRQAAGMPTLPGMPKGGPALVTQRPQGHIGRKARTDVQHRDPTKTRSGKAFEQGARGVGTEALIRQAKQAEKQVTTAENAKLIEQEFAVGRPTNTKDRAQAMGERITHDPKTGELKPNQRELVPVEVSRNRWRLFPEDVLARFEEHADVAPNPALDKMTSAFKNVVLTTASPAHWLGGNVADIGMRSVMAGLTPADVARGYGVAKATAKKGLQGEQAIAAITGGGLFGVAEGVAARNPLRAVREAARSRVEENPARTVLSAPWRGWKASIYSVEHLIEELPQWGALGKAAKADIEMKQGLKGMLRLQDEQVDNFATRLAGDRALEAQMQKAAEDVIGRWGKVSPSMRKALGVAPFAQWLGASTRYVLVTLPVKHPIKTGVLAGISEMTEEERMRLGLSAFLPVDKQAQGYQMGTLPMRVVQGKYGPEVTGTRTSRMTSLGALGGLIQEGPQGYLFPQVAGALNAWAGTSYTGEKLVYPEWWPEKHLRGIEISDVDKHKIAVGALMEAVTPFASAFRRSILEKGRPAEPFSTILTPATRKERDPETNTYSEREGSAKDGIIEWLMPVSKPSKIYTYGAGKSISDSRTTFDTLEEWRKKADADKAARERDGIGLRGPATTAPAQGTGSIDLRGADANAPSVKQRKRARSLSSGGLIPLR